MISVLIPIYNRNVLDFVEDVKSQLEESTIPFEIICLEDGSDGDKTNVNKVLNQLSHVTYYINKANQGRIKSRQALSDYAQYDWLLFLDADLKIKNQNFIKSYIEAKDFGYDAIFGGFAYYESPPSKDFLLRWKYGREREEVMADQRNIKPYKVVISANYLIKKNIFQNIYGKIDYKGYGYDNYYGALLKENNVKVYHIDNEVYHLGIEKSDMYLKKKEEAAEALVKLYKSENITAHDNNLLNLFSFLYTYKLHHAGKLIYSFFSKAMRTNLLGENPSIKILQLYRICFMCYIEESY